MKKAFCDPTSDVWAPCPAVGKSGERVHPAMNEKPPSVVVLLPSFQAQGPSAKAAACSSPLPPRYDDDRTLPSDLMSAWKMSCAPPLYAFVAPGKPWPAV